MNNTGWEQLDCTYFASTCRDLLGGPLLAKGFMEESLTPGGGLIYARGDVLIELNYDTNLYPSYGLTASLRERAPSSQLIPGWFLVPASHPYRTRLHWMFSRQEDLSNILPEVWVELIDPAMIPLADDPDARAKRWLEFQSTRGST